MRKRAFFAAGLLSVALACGHDVTGPTGAVQALSLTAVPDSLAPGTSIQLEVTALYTTGESKNVASTAIWTSSNPAVLKIANGGQASGVQDGEAGATANFGGRSASKAVFVLEKGTWALSGSVGDPFGLPGAFVEVVSGTGAGKSATTDAGGSFRLYGLDASSQIRASLDGYVADTQAIKATGGLLQRLTFFLQPTVALLDVSGDWQLIFQASPSCESAFAVAQPRTYTASIEQKGSVLKVTLSGAEFAPDLYYGDGKLMNTFWPSMRDNAFTLSLATYSDIYGYGVIHYDLGELLPDHRLLTIVGKGSGVVTPSSIVVPFDGRVSVSATSLGTVTCQATDHRFTFARTATAARRRR